MISSYPGSFPIFVCNLCLQSLFTILVYNLCLQSLFTIFVYNLGLQSLFTIFVYNLCYCFEEEKTSCIHVHCDLARLDLLQKKYWDDSELVSPDWTVRLNACFTGSDHATLRVVCVLSQNMYKI